MTPSPGPSPSSAQESRFRWIYRAAHAGHRGCAEDEWLSVPCRGPDGEPLDRPVVWSRRNGAWRQVEILWVGAAPGNAGARGSGPLGAHGTRIPFGGDIAGANLEVLFGSIGIVRNETFITAALNQLPSRGGGEPTVAEIAAPVSAYPSSLHLLRDTILAGGPRLVVALGTIGLRAALAAGGVEDAPAPELVRGEPGPVPGPAVPAAGTTGRTPRLPGPARLAAAGLRRGEAAAWPELLAPSAAFTMAWRTAWGSDTPLPAILWLLHPSAQNMSPYASEGTAFHRRMLETRDALVAAVRHVLGRRPPRRRPTLPTTGIYALPEWRERIAPRLQAMDELWRARGV